jgi:DNA topoisomerase-1
LDLFKLPRALGETPEGEEVFASIGRFGPYVRYGSKFASLKEDDPYTINLERALEVIAEKKLADANRLIQDFPDKGIQVLNGRYGPYVTNGSKNAKIPKDKDPKSLTLDECEAMIEAAPERGARRGKKKAAASKPATGETTNKAVSKKAAKKKKKKKAKKKTGKKKTAASKKPSERPAKPAESD